MKVASFVLKIVAASLALAAAVCCVIAYWDKIGEALGACANKVRSKSFAGLEDDPEDDYADWDE